MMFSTLASSQSALSYLTLQKKMTSHSQTVYKIVILNVITCLVLKIYACQWEDGSINKVPTVETL